MDNLGTWAVLSVPLFVALTSRLKRQPQNVAYWIYFWGLGGSLLFLKWQGYHLYLAGQQLELGLVSPDALGEYLLNGCFDEVLILSLMVLPPIWYLYDKRKMLTRSLSQS